MFKLCVFLTQHYCVILIIVFHKVVNFQDIGLYHSTTWCTVTQFKTTVVNSSPCGAAGRSGGHSPNVTDFLIF